MEIHLDKFKEFVAHVPSIFKDVTDMDVRVQSPPGIVPGGGELCPEECMLRGLTYATAVTMGTTVVLYLPYMCKDGTFIIKGQRRYL